MSIEQISVRTQLLVIIPVEMVTKIGIQLYSDAMDALLKDLVE